MKIRMIGLQQSHSFLLAAIPAHAQARFEVDPFVGYETSASYPVSITTGPDRVGPH